MFIKKIKIKNFRLFSAEEFFEINDLNIPDDKNDGSGLNIFVGENGNGKTALLDAFAMPLLEYKKDSFSVNDFNNTEEKTEIRIFSEKNIKVPLTMPRGEFKARGFEFTAGIRKQNSKTYLSSLVVSDQKFIKINGLDKPADWSPDLRLNVNNPYKGKRFNENDIVFLDKNRLSQTHSGTFNSTRFDRLMSDFNFQYLLGGEVVNLNEDLNKRINKREDETIRVESEFLTSAMNKFEEMSGLKISLDFINNLEPFKNAFFTSNSDVQQVPLKMSGSGYEMIFSLLYAFYLSRQSEKQLIILIDEPELHLHPNLQEKFVKSLLEFSKNAQIIITSHSPLLIKQLSYNDKININILRKKDGNKKIEVVSIDEKLLSYNSANEINYLAFEFATEEYHNELFEELKFLKGDDKSIKIFDRDYFVKEKEEKKNSPWLGHENEVSIHTFIRNQIHHQKDNGKADYIKLKSSIIKMRAFLGDI